MPKISLSNSEKQLQDLTDDEKRALRASKFAPIVEIPSSKTKAHISPFPRMAHPGGPIATNKAIALSKFLKRKIDSGEADDLNPDLVELAVRSAQSTLTSGSKVSESRIKHVDKFDDSEEKIEKPELRDSSNRLNGKINKKKKTRKKKKKNRNSIAMD